MIRVALVVVAAGLLVLLTVRTMLTAALPANVDAGALPLSSPRLTLNAAMLKFAAAETAKPPRRLPDSFYAPILVAARQEPVAAEPFFLLGMKAYRSGDRARATRLFEEARRRNPRLRYARVFLMVRYLEERQIEPAVVEMKVITRLVPEATKLVAEQFARVAKEPGMAPTVRAALRRDALLEPVLEELVNQKAPLSLVLWLGRDSRTSATEMMGWRRLVLQSLVEQRRVREAKSVWRGFLGRAAPPANTLLYDAGFQGLPGGAPFNWELSVGALGSVELTKRRELDVDYFGRLSGPLASQLLTLTPGRYRLAFTAEGSADGSAGSGLAWQIDCVEQRQLANWPVKELRTAPRRLGGEFTVPAGCTGQWLRLVGNAPEFPAPQNMRLKDMTLQRVS